MKKLTNARKLDLRRRTVKLLDRAPLLAAVGGITGMRCGGDGSNCCSDDCTRSFLVVC
jgi:hypothetical protein